MGILICAMSRISAVPLLPVACFPPIADPRARVLILGSMPGRESLRAQQYYAHPRNVFWRIMGDLSGATPTLAYADRIRILKSSGIAVWDVLASCTRSSSLDADIDSATVEMNDFEAFYSRHRHITQVFFNGAMAEKFYFKHIPSHLSLDLQYQRLPSTSPAHAGMPYLEKLNHWRVIMQHLEHDG